MRPTPMKPLNFRSADTAPRPGWMQDIGLRPGWGWLADPRFGLALLAGLLFWRALAWLAEPAPAPGLAALASLILLQPLLEELLFRGLLQGRLRARPWGRRQLGGFTLANLFATLLFTALHFISHPPLWAAGVLLPSLLYGYFRDRHDSVLPAIAQHVFYNAGYFLLPFIWKG
jgi:membrane protease YdiL (CAAX protease family)